MTPLPGALGGRDLIAWRLDREVYAKSWDSGEGAYRAGGRWNSKGVRAVYCALDPATAILEVAVHLGFDVLDSGAYRLTCLAIADPSRVRVIQPDDIPNPNWLVPAPHSGGQRRFGDDLIKAHDFVVLPSVVSRHSWNLIFLGGSADKDYSLVSQERFALDTRLNP